MSEEAWLAEAEAMDEQFATLDGNEHTLEELGYERAEFESLVQQDGQWVPYRGPRGGEGWRNAETGDIVYDDEPPGEKADDATDQYDTDYDVSNEVEAEVARTIDEASYSDMTSNHWQSLAGEVEDTELLLDYLDGYDDIPKSSRTRIRGRLRSLGMTDGEIDETLKDQEFRPGEPLALDDLEEGMDIQVDGNEVTFKRSYEDAHGDTMFEVEKADGSVMAVPDFQFGNSDIRAPGELEEYESTEDVVAGLKAVDYDAMSEYTAGPPEEVREVWNKASDDQLREAMDVTKGNRSDLAAAMLWYRQDGDAAEFDISEVSMGEVEDAMNEAGMREDMIEDVLDAANGDPEKAVDHVANLYGVGRHEKVKDALEPDSSGVDVDDVFDVNVEADGHRASPDSVRHGLSKAMDKMDPVVGAYSSATVKRVDMEEITMAGTHSKDGVITVDPTGYNPDSTAAHELGHHVHKTMGIAAKNYGTVDNRNSTDREAWDFGTPRSFVPEDAYDMYDEALENWEGYKDGDVQEMRSYQKRHGVEYLAVSFEKWADDQNTIEYHDPPMAAFWEKHAGGAEEVSSSDELQAGDKVVIQEGSRAEMIEVTDIDGDKVESSSVTNSTTEEDDVDVLDEIMVDAYRPDQ